MASPSTVEAYAKFIEIDLQQGKAKIQCGTIDHEFQISEIPTDSPKFKIYNPGDEVTYVVDNVFFKIKNEGLGGDNRKIIWSCNMCNLLFTLYSELHTQYAMRKTLYMKIADGFVLQDIKYIYITGSVIEIKWKSLLRAFKNAKLKAQGTGGGAITFKYYDRMMVLLENNRSVFPEAVSGRNGVRVSHTQNENEIPGVPVLNETDQRVAEEIVDDPEADADQDIDHPQNLIPAADVAAASQVRKGSGKRTPKRRNHTADALQKCAATFDDSLKERKTFEDKVFLQYKQNSENTETYRREKLKMMENLMNKWNTQ